MVAVQRGKFKGGKAPASRRNEAPSSPEAAIYDLQGFSDMGGMSHGDPSQAGGSGLWGTNNRVEGSGSCGDAGQDW